MAGSVRACVRGGVQCPHPVLLTEEASQGFLEAVYFHQQEGLEGGQH